jgi:hypothetical protein
MPHLSDIGIACEFSAFSSRDITYLYHNRARDKFRGPYKLDEVTGNVTGNPARSACIEDLLKTIKNKAGANGGHRNHAEAIRIEDVSRIMEMSEKECPGNVYAHIKDASELKMATEHLLMRAFIASGFTLWTRYMVR